MRTFTKLIKIFICCSFSAPDNFSFYWGDVLKNNIAPLQGSRPLLWFSSFHTICINSFAGSLPCYLCTCVFLWSAEVLPPHSTAVSEFMEYLSRKQLSCHLGCHVTEQELETKESKCFSGLHAELGITDGTKHVTSKTWRSELKAGNS